MADNDLPTEDNPFGDITSDPRDAVPQPMNAGQVALASAGLALMALGGLGVLVGVILLGAEVPGWIGGDPGAALVATGSGTCVIGYGLFNKARKRRPRRP
jgi:hypothetical protein